MKHIRKVLRLKAGDQVIIFDGSGKEYEGTIVEEEPSSVMIKIQNIFSSKKDSPLEVTLAQSLLKGEKMDYPDPEGHGVRGQRNHSFFLLPFSAPFRKIEKTETPSSMGKNCH